MHIITAYGFAKANGLDKEVANIRSGKLHKWKYGTSVRRGLLVEALEQNDLLTKFVAMTYPELDANEVATRLNKYRKILAGYCAFIEGKTDPVAQVVEESDEEDDSLKFAIESHLRDFLAKNLHLLEPGLKLFNENGRHGIEYPIANGRIDILALDKDNVPVVIELKLSRGRNRTLGQILYYMGWIDQNLGLAPSRGMIVASEITPDLITAVQRIPSITLAKYKMTFGIDVVHTSN